MSSLYQGIWVALWTPTDEKESLLEEPIRQHLDFLIDSGVTGIVVGGSTGQFPYLTVNTRKHLLQLVRQRVGDHRVMVNISAQRPADVANLATDTSQTDVSAVMLLPPSFYAFSQHDIAHYLTHMAAIAKRPLMLYNFPECVRNNIELDTIKEVSHHVNLVGIKHSGANFDYHIPLIALGRDLGFEVITGADSRLAEALSLGVVGSIGALSNAIPELMVKLHQSFQQGDDVAVDQTTNQITNVHQLMNQLLFPINTAALMKARGFNPGTTKEILSPETQRKYQEVVEALRICLH